MSIKNTYQATIDKDLSIKRTHQAPPPSYDSQPKHDYDYYKHEHHHYYHAGPPRVYKVPVPVTQKPHIVHVPQVRKDQETEKCQQLFFRMYQSSLSG